MSESRGVDSFHVSIFPYIPLEGVLGFEVCHERVSAQAHRHPFSKTGLSNGQSVDRSVCQSVY